jgi:hypothetical protein
MRALPNQNFDNLTMKNVERLNFYVLFNHKILILVYIPQTTTYCIS